MVHGEMDEAACRVCLEEGRCPRGLADIPVQPCACSHLHLSCLHLWQRQRVATGRDPSQRELCRQPNQVPEAAWAALQAGGGIKGDRRSQGSWRAVRQGLAWQHAKCSLLLLGALGAWLALQRWAPGQLGPLTETIADVSITLATGHVAFCAAFGRCIEKGQLWGNTAVERAMAWAAGL
ncbi:hypothetical protein ABPG75_002567 [Micractinium tetrahymenae]